MLVTVTATVQRCTNVWRVDLMLPEVQRKRQQEEEVKEKKGWRGGGGLLSPVMPDIHGWG